MPLLLRAPPFPQASAVVAEPSATPVALPANALDMLSDARVGGAFWADGAHDPWTALATATRLAAHGDDEQVAIAAILGLPVEVLSSGRYGHPGDKPETLRERARQALADIRYIDPFTGASATFATTVALLAQWRREIEANRAVSVASGMAWWKRDEIRRFLWVPGRKLPIVSRATAALKVARKHGGAVAIWPSRVSPELIAKAREQGTGLVRVEDGFVRSVGLGSNLVPPSSVVVDARGIHFDPSAPSDLEHILATTGFSPDLTKRAATLRETIVSAGISKYSAGGGSPVPQRAEGRRLVLVPAQVEDDMSVLAGGGGLHSNLELLKRVRALEPEAEIWFRPHPDVDAGHRKGAVPDADALQFADRIVRGGGMAALLNVVDAVHCNTSLTGFEALMRGRDVTCHGTPFYAGWGLTRDLGAVPDRRGRKLTLDELVAGVLILYPRYLDPVTGLPCPPEVLVSRMASAATPNRIGWVAPLRRWQGRFMAYWR
nr:beta-3-deoxy-D-manno-oct-2-ulosonic acid transferase [Novosphingobium hassiacum]